MPFSQSSLLKSSFGVCHAWGVAFILHVVLALNSHSYESPCPLTSGYDRPLFTLRISFLQYWINPVILLPYSLCCTSETFTYLWLSVCPFVYVCDQLVHWMIHHTEGWWCHCAHSSPKFLHSVIELLKPVRIPIITHILLWNSYLISVNIPAQADHKQ